MSTSEMINALLQFISTDDNLMSMIQLDTGLVCTMRLQAIQSIMTSMTPEQLTAATQALGLYTGTP